MDQATRRRKLRAMMQDLDESVARRARREGDKEGSRQRERTRWRLAERNLARVHERQIGESDLLRVNYLERGVRAGRSVCLIEVRDGAGSPVATGTGFMISPRLLMTNAHVLLDEEEGLNSLACFDYQDDVHSIPMQRMIFALRGNEFFYRNEALDYAIVAVAPTDIRGSTPLSSYGHLRLRPDSGKAIENEAVTIIQHPMGRSKEIACRSNRILKRVDAFVHYETDTDSGSSGSPVFSDEWELVALHHAGVRRTNDQGEILNKDGGIWHPEQGEDQLAWSANEGIRISSIVAHLRGLLEDGTLPDGMDPGLLVEAVREADMGAGPTVVVRPGIDEERRNTAWYAAAEGYRAGFLFDDGDELPLPDYSSHPEASDVLHYRNFSLVMHQGRRQALFTACNIDGTRRVQSSADADWKLDPRLGSEFQLDNEFYKDQSERTNRLDRGHLVKRTDPCWGDIGVEAIADTFHFTNAALQHRSFNNGIWGRLEDSLEGRFEDRTIMTVFTGPVFGHDDPEVVINHEGTIQRAQIPLQFWKVIAFADDQGWLTAAAFRQSQANLIEEMDANFADDRETSVLTLETVHVPIVEIELLTGLGFGYLSDYEATDDQLEARGDRFRRTIRGPSDLILRSRSGNRRPTRLARVRGSAGSGAGSMAEQAESEA